MPITFFMSIFIIILVLTAGLGLVLLLILHRTESRSRRVSTVPLYSINPNPLGCVQNRIQIGRFGTVWVNVTKVMGLA